MDSNVATVSIVIPAKNEAATIAAVISELKKQSEISEIIVVDDGSTDGTASIAASAGAQVVTHRKTKGNGAAVKSGLRAAKSEFVIIMDADGQHSVDDVKQMAAFPPDVDLVVGSRGFTWSRFRDFGNLFLARVASFLVGEKIPDLTSGLRRLNRRIALAYLPIYPQGFSFPSTSTILFMTSGCLVNFHPIRNVPRPSHASPSKLRPIPHGIKFLTIIYRVVLLSYPLKFFLPVGLFFIALGIAWTIRTLMLTAQISALGAMLLLSGLTFLLFGTIADQLSQIRKSLAVRDH